MGKGEIDEKKLTQMDFNKIIKEYVRVYYKLAKIKGRDKFLEIKDYYESGLNNNKMEDCLIIEEKKEKELIETCHQILDINPESLKEPIKDLMDKADFISCELNSVRLKIWSILVDN
ncbi:MAG: hypothetical protein JW804_09055 [Sedimentisphaerales bacterium]|nr:hypothetical protein [Sedimentisphaerales bacterium]